MKTLSVIFSDVSRVVFSSGVQLGITLLTTPIMTRLYTPSAYAVFGILNTAAAVLVGISLLSLTNAYPAEKDGALRTRLAHTMLLLVIIATLVAGAVSVGMLGGDFLKENEISAFALAFFPLLVLTYGIRSIVVSIATYHAHFKAIAMGQMVEPCLSRGGSILLGAIGGSQPAFILVSLVAGYLATTSILCRKACGWSLQQIKTFRFASPRPLAVIAHFSDFVLYNTFSSQILPLLMLGLQMMIVAFFAQDIAGQYILASSIITLPVSLVALSTAPVTYRHFIEIEASAPSMLLRHLLLAAGSYLLAGIVMLLPLIFFGPQIFGIVFGEIWMQAGDIASTLCIPYAISFATVGLQGIFMVTRRLRFQCVLYIATYSVVFALAFYFFMTQTFEVALFNLALCWGLRNIIELCASIAVTCTHAHSTTTTSSLYTAPNHE